MEDPRALGDITILELADQRGEFCGRLLAGMGARVIKVEPPEGSPTRDIGPFYQDDPHPERSLHFWHYNAAKEGVTLDISRPEGRDLFKELASKAHLLLTTSKPGHFDGLGLGYEVLREINPALVFLSMTDFGETGPHKDYKGSDLVFLALGGQMMLCGYGPNEAGELDTPPIAPQMWQSAHISCSMAAMDALAALWHARMTGEGQYIDFSIHTAVNSCTENNLATYEAGKIIGTRRPTYVGSIRSEDGYNMITSGGLFEGEWEREVRLLEQYGAAEDLADPKYRDPSVRFSQAKHINEVRGRFIAQQRADELMVTAQNQGVIWCTVRPPEGSLDDDHFTSRGNFAPVEFPELGESFTDVGSPWVAPAMPWRTGLRAPLLGEHNAEVYGSLLGKSEADLAGLRRSGVI